MREVVMCPHHGVDVRGVEQGEAPRHPGGRGDDKQPVTARPGQALLAYPGQGGQEAVFREPVGVGGMAGENRAVRRRAADTRR